MRKWFLAGVAACFASTTNAQIDECDRSLILSLSQDILDQRENLQGFAGGRFGGDAAYFMLRYGDGDPDKIFAALSTGRAFRQAAEMEMAYRITQLGPDGIGDWGAAPEQVMIDSWWPVKRAILLLDEGQTFFEILDRIEADADLNNSFSRRWLHGTAAHAMLTDQPPEVIEAIANRAEDRGELVFAGALYALLPAGAYEAFWDRHQTSEGVVAGLASPLNMNANGTIALRRAVPLLVGTEPEGLDVLMFRNQMFQSLRSGLSEGGSTVLPIVMNQSGRMADTALVAEAYLAAVETGEIDPVAHPQDVWVYMLSAISEQFGQRDAVQVLSSFDFAADRRHYAGNTLSVLEMATVAKAVGPWLRGQTDQPPEQPPSLAPGYDWAGTIAVATRVKEGEAISPEGLTDTQRAVAVEAMLQSGQLAPALDLAEQIGGLTDRLIVARDVINRQNRLCDQHGILPGAPLLLGGLLLYDFQ